MALASLGATRDYEDPIRATLAQRIIALAEAGERDPERLCVRAPCGPSALLLHPDPTTLRRAVQPPESHQCPLSAQFADSRRTSPEVREVPIADIRIAPNYFRAYSIWSVIALH
jgi:hypothetical protein